MKAANGGKGARRRTRFELTGIKELQELRNIGGLRFEKIDSAQMLAIHREVVLIGFDGVVRESLLDSKVLKKSIDPLLISHYGYWNSTFRVLLTARNSASSRVCNKDAVQK